jgi:hypothetical protein
MSSSDPSQTPLIALLGVRKAAEEAATQRLAAASARRVAAQEVQDRLDAAVRGARAELRALRSAKASPSPSPSPTAADAAGRERFWSRIRDEIAAQAARASAHRAGALATARAEVSAAVATQRAARAARALVEKLHQKADAARRQLASRRADLARDDDAQAIGQSASAHARRSPSPSPGDVPPRR